MYEASLLQKWDYQNGIDFAVKRQRKKKEIKQIKKKQAAKIPKENNLPFELISKATGLTTKEIEMYNR